MIPKTVERSAVFSEFSQKETQLHFSLTRGKVLPHIDNLYYNVFLYGDGGEDLSEGLQLFLSELAEAKYRKKQAYENEVELYGLDVYPSNFATYEFRLSANELFDIFVASYLPNSSTPRIHVQIRSRLLILRGETNAINDTFDKLLSILKVYGLEVSQVVENRIDYAYHTNLIQNPKPFFSDKSLEKHCKTTFRKGQKVFYFAEDLKLVYFSLGFRTSNSLFFRCYDKSREVCEKAYKGFFLDRWRQNGLISNYDYFCYLEAYQKASYTVGLLIGRIKWYLKFGKNDSLKVRLVELLQKCYLTSCNTEVLRKELKGVLPEVTVILNLEFETKRKFYATFEDDVEPYTGPELPPERRPLLRLFQVLASREMIHNYLTSKTVRFVEDRQDAESEMLDFWKRIHSCKVAASTVRKLVRDYFSVPDLKRAEKEFMASTAKLALTIQGELTSGFEDDLSCVLSNLNDNHFYGFRTSPTGEVIQMDPGGYYEIRKKKAHQARHLIEDLRLQHEEKVAQERETAAFFKEFIEREQAREEKNDEK